MSIKRTPSIALALVVGAALTGCGANIRLASARADTLVSSSPADSLTLSSPADTPALSSLPPSSELPSPVTSSAALASSPAATATPTPPASQLPTPITADAPCAGLAAPRAYAHVIWIWMENKPFGSVIGSSNAPYENALASHCGLATDYHGVTHPSLPNYLAATGGSTFGVTDDGFPLQHQIADESIFGQLTGAGLTWRSYDESMPVNCAQSSSGLYAVKHNPAAYFTAIASACATNDVPFEGNFDNDVAAGTLPSFSFVTPNMCSDTHDCLVKTGDDWLATYVPLILSGPNYQAGNTLLVLTWDEGVGKANLTPAIMVAPSVLPGSIASARFDHYSLLRTTEDLLGLPPLAAAATAPSMATAFGLGPLGG